MNLFTAVMAPAPLLERHNGTNAGDQHEPSSVGARHAVRIGSLRHRAGAGYWVKTPSRGQVSKAVVGFGKKSFAADYCATPLLSAWRAPRGRR